LWAAPVAFASGAFYFIAEIGPKTSYWRVKIGQMDV
jgi:hypothetical protein